MKTLLIVTVSLFLSASLWAQERKVIVEYTEGGKKVVREFSGKGLDELQAKASLASHTILKATPSAAPAQKQIVVQVGNKPPVTYSGAKLDELMAKDNKSSQHAIIPAAKGISVTSIRQPDGSVKMVRNGIEEPSK